MLLALRNGTKEIRGKAAQALMFGLMGKDLTEEQLCPLLQALEDPQEMVRSIVAMTLHSTKDPRAVVALTQALKDSSPHVASHAAMSLGHIGDPAAVPALAAACQHPTAEVSVAALGALAKIDLNHPEVQKGRETLLSALRDTRMENMMAKMHAAQALGQMQADWARDALLEALESKDEFSGHFAMMGLSLDQGVALDNRILRMLKHERSSNRSMAVQLIAARRPENMPELLRPLLHDKEDHVRWSAAIPLYLSGDPEALKMVEDASISPDPEQREWAARAKGRVEED